MPLLQVGLPRLHGAVMFSQPIMARWLLEHGADPNPKYENKTPLAIVLENNQPDLAYVLRSFGAIE